MFQSFFNPENPIFRFTGRVLDILVLSTMWVVCSLPVVTIGPASAALYYSCVKCLRYKEGGAYRSFLSAFRLNLKTGIGATAVLLVLGAALDAGYLFFTMAAGTGSQLWGMLRVAYLVLLLLPMSVLTCVFPLLSRFTCTVGGALSTSLRLTFRHLPRLIAAAAVNTICVIAAVRVWYYGLILLIPALDALTVSYLLEPVFRKYTPGEESDGDKPWYLR